MEHLKVHQKQHNKAKDKREDFRFWRKTRTQKSQGYRDRCLIKTKQDQLLVGPTTTTKEKQILKK